MNTDNGTGLSLNMKVDGVSDKFPAGLRVLVVDDDPTCLKILDKMLRNCLYEVTTSSRAVEALSILRERKGGFDLVISDVYMPDMDGFKLLEHIGLEMDLPVIMMSVDDGKSVVMKGITHGACDYLIKPVRMEAIKNIWQHVIRKKRNEWKEAEHSGSMEDSDRYRKPSDDGDYACSANEGSWKHSKRRKDVTDEEDDGEDRDDTSALKKPRVVWSVELHQQFVAAVNQLGIDKAVPKKILELMNVPGLTRENVASHLQKYRLYLRRLSGVTHHQGGFNTPFMGGPEATYGSIASLDRFDFQALAFSGQLQQQNLTTLQAGLGRISTNPAMNMSIADPINFLNSEVQGGNSSSKLRYGPGQHLLGNNQVGLLQGLPSPTTLESKHLAQLHQPIQSIGNTGIQLNDGASSFLNLPPQLRTMVSSPGVSVNSHQRSVSSESNSLMMKMDIQHQQRTQILPSSMGPQMVSKEVSGLVFGRNGFVTNGKGTSALGNCINNPSFGVVSRTSGDYSISELPGNAFPLVSAGGVSSLTSTGMIREAIPVTAVLEGLDESINLSGENGMVRSYDLFSDFRQSKRQDWNLQNVNLSCEATQHVNSIQNNPDFRQSLLGNRDLDVTQKNGQIKGMCFIGKGMVSSREGSQLGNLDHIVQQHNNLLGNNSLRVKAESLPDIDCEGALLTEHFGQDDIMNALFKQQQEGDGPVESEFNFDGFQMDNIHV